MTPCCTAPAERSNILLKIADRMEANLELLATAETWDNGKPIREALARCITRDEPSRFSPVMATDDAGRFAGLVRLERLITALMDEPVVADGSTSGGCAVASEAP